MKVFKRISFILGAVLVLTSVNLGSIVFAGGPEVLRGLKGVYPVATGLEPKIERKGLRTSTLQTDMELKLRVVGIKVLSEKELFEAIGNPTLYLNVQVHRTKCYVYDVTIELRERVVSRRRPMDVIWAATFIIPGTYGYVCDLSDIRNSAKDVMDEFINAYLYVNTK